MPPGGGWVTDEHDRGVERAFDAARGLYQLALDYADRSHAAEAELVGAFEAEAAALAREVGELVVDDDDDERLVLSARGRFTGRVLADDASPGWQTLDSADDIVDYYDPVDLFEDLADAIAEAFPGMDEEERVTWGASEQQGASDADAVAGTATPERSASAAPKDEPAQKTEMLRVLEDLHAAGAMTDAQFEAQKAEIGE